MANCMKSTAERGVVSGGEKSCFQTCCSVREALQNKASLFFSFFLFFRCLEPANREYGSKLVFISDRIGLEFLFFIPIQSIDCLCSMVKKLAIREELNGTHSSDRIGLYHLFVNIIPPIPYAAAAFQYSFYSIRASSMSAASLTRSLARLNLAHGSQVARITSRQPVRLVAPIASSFFRITACAYTTPTSSAAIRLGNLQPGQPTKNVSIVAPTCLSGRHSQETCLLTYPHSFCTPI